jgi:hypothetical protein
MAPLGAHRLGAINQSARPDALATGRPIIEQTKPLGTSATPRAYEHRPKAAIPEAAHLDADLIFDLTVVEPDARCLCFAPDVAERHQGRHANHRQIIDRALHKLRTKSSGHLCLFCCAWFHAIPTDALRAFLRAVPIRSSVLALRPGLSDFTAAHPVVPPIVTGGRFLVFWQFWQWVGDAGFNFRGVGFAVGAAKAS